jgi:hypothetical protein
MAPGPSLTDWISAVASGLTAAAASYAALRPPVKKNLTG